MTRSSRTITVFSARMESDSGDSTFERRGDIEMTPRFHWSHPTRLATATAATSQEKLGLKTRRERARSSDKLEGHVPVYHLSCRVQVAGPWRALGRARNSSGVTLVPIRPGHGEPTRQKMEVQGGKNLKGNGLEQ